jgi:BirA family biotin operon repressor/biotin-[acetyl-CoA-carboxylase] ligase
MSTPQDSLQSVESSLCSAIILGRLKLQTKVIGKSMLCYPSLPSTMDMAREEALKGVPEGSVVLTDEQTAGRGRLGRLWYAPRGSLSLTVVLRPPVKALPQLVMLSSLAVVQAIESVTGMKAQIKWPNDVLLNGKKVCGILIENMFHGNEFDFSLLGFGLNVNFHPADYAEIADIATSLMVETGNEVSLLTILSSLLLQVERLYATVKAGRTVQPQWVDRLETIGRKVSVRYKEGDAVEEGVAESVDKEGNLRLRRADDKLVTVVAGDVTLQPEPNLPGSSSPATSRNEIPLSFAEGEGDIRG